MTKELLQIEFRYLDAPKGEYDSEHKSKTVTIGIFDTFVEACEAGNNLMKELESRFALHTFPDGRQARKERFSKTGGPFGTPLRLITNMAYLKTPFQFYATITQLKFDDVDATVNNMANALNNYKKWTDSIK